MNQSTNQRPLSGFKSSSGNNNIYTTLILSVVLYGCKTWSLTLKEEERLKVFENRGLRIIF
jgi:hypothetical protein